MPAKKQAKHERIRAVFLIMELNKPLSVSGNSQSQALHLAWELYSPGLKLLSKLPCSFYTHRCAAIVSLLTLADQLCYTCKVVVLVHNKVIGRNLGHDVEVDVH